MCSAKFIYLLSPGEVNANSMVNFTLSISNPSQVVQYREGNGLNFLSNQRLRSMSASGDEIDMFWLLGDGQNDLAPNLDAVTAVSLSEGWQIAIVPSSFGSYFKIFPVGSGTILPGHSIAFSISNVTINPFAGPSLVEFLEFLADGEGTANQTLLKKAQSLSITARINTPIVGRDQPTRLQWTVTGGAFVHILPEDVTRPVNGDPFTDSMLVFPQPRQTIYSLTVRTVTGESQQAKPNPVATVSKPLIRYFEPQGLAPIAIDALVDLSWKVDYATRVFLTVPNAIRVNPEDTREVQPKDLLHGNESRVEYLLRAEGYEGPVQQTVTIEFQPAQVFYFRYRTPAKDFTEWDGINYLSFSESIVGDLRTLTVIGPGGPVVRHLGPGPYLEIPLFYAEPPVVPKGQPTTLHWETQNAVELLLDPGGIVIPADQIAKGQMEVSPEQTTDYNLVATAADGSQITSLLKVQVTS